MQINHNIVPMEDKILFTLTWSFTLIGIFTFNNAALLLSMFASVTIILRNRNETISFLIGAMEKFKRWLTNKKL